MRGRMRTTRRLPARLFLTLWMLLGALTAERADAAAIMAFASADTIQIGESAEITVTLNLKAGEVASGYFARLDLSGQGSVIEIIEVDDVEIGGPTWDTANGPTLDDHRYDIGFDLGSDNEGGTRLVAVVTVTGLGEGVSEMMMGSGNRGVQRIDSVPFEDEVWLDPIAGVMLTSITVVPEPATLLLACAGIAALAARRARRRV